MNGTVAWFDARTGTGVISPDDGSADVSVHYTQIDGGGRQSLRATDRVSFTPADGPDGPTATRVFLP